MRKAIGRITQVLGGVVDVKFDNETDLPAVLDAIVVKDQKNEVVLEVQQHIGGGTVRTVAMASTNGLKRGLEVEATGAPISVPVGKGTLGRLFNVLGTAIDNKGV
jgi:F-type H+-transporting ATPase subunit beta